MGKSSLTANVETTANGWLPSSELLWAVYGFIQAAENTGNQDYLTLAQKWQTWMDYTKTTGAKVCHALYCLYEPLANESFPDLL